MESSAVEQAPPAAAKQPLLTRVGFFVVGGAMSSMLNRGILWFTQKLHWPSAGGLALSVAVTAVVFFIWSYYVNFRTSKSWNACLPRYLGCLVICNVLNYVISLSGIKKFGTGFWEAYFVIVVVYSFTGCVKFVLYNYWVFPSGGAGAPPSAE